MSDQTRDISSKCTILIKTHFHQMTMTFTGCELLLFENLRERAPVSNYRIAKSCIQNKILGPFGNNQIKTASVR